MLLPYEVVGLAIALVVAGLTAASWVAPGLATRLPPTFPGGSDPQRRTRQVRSASLALLAIVVVGAFVLRAAGAPLAPDDRPLGFGHAWGGDDPRLLAAMGLERGDQLFFAYAPGAEIRTGITLANDGNVPLTVTGLEPPLSPYVRSLELRLPPGTLSPDLLPVYPGEGVRWTSEPFHPFDIPAHGEVALGLAVTLGTCTGMMPLPTLAPGASLLPESDPRLDLGGFDAVDALRIHYTAFGISRTATVTLRSVLLVVTGAAGGCPSG